MLKLFISSENDAHVVIFDFHKGVKHPFIPIREVGNCFSQLPKEVMKMKGIIVGASLISEQHCEAYLINDIEIYGICDKKVETAEKMAEKYAPNAKIYNDFEKILDEDVDFITICTPSGTHAELAIKVMKAGKHAVVEKPIALTPEDCDRIIATEAETGKVCVPIAQLRFSDTFTKVKSAFESEEFGQPIMASLSMKYFRSREYYAGSWHGSKTMDGGEMMNQGIHGIDMMCGIIGKPVSVSGKVDTKYHDIEAEDTAVACIEFENGMFAVLDSSTALPNSKPRRLELNGTKGFIAIHEATIAEADNVNLEASVDLNFKGNDDPKSIGPQLHGEIYKSFISHIIKGTPMHYTAEDASVAVKLICAINESSEKGCAIKL